jgi:hypothetical protein
MICCFREGREDVFCLVFRIKDWFCAMTLDINNEGPPPALCRFSVFQVTTLPQLHAQRHLVVMTEEQMLVGMLIGTRGSAHQNLTIHIHFCPPRCQIEPWYQ